MMQFLGFGASPSTMERGARNPTSSTTSSLAPSPISSTLSPGQPVRLVYCDDHGKFRMDPEAVAALQIVKGPIGVVSVCGRARQGKSFILNQLLGRSSGFQVAPTHRPCTKGLWMWSAPIKLTALDGTELNLLLLDSEGIDAYDQTGTYSTQIFSLAILLSSLFIYNQMGGIDEAALDRLSLVTQMTKHIRVRASGARSTMSEIGQFSPVFVWLLRDFYLELAEDNHKITPRDYLELALRPVKGYGKDISSKNEVRESIRALFPDRECFALVRPLNDESDLQRLDQIPLDSLRPEFKSGLDAFARFVFERTRPKQLGATIMNGPLLAGVTQSFLDAINNGAVPTISSSWQSVEEAECRRAYDVASEVYLTSFDRTKPAEEAVLQEAHEIAVKKSLDAFNAAAVGTGLVRVNYEKRLHGFTKKTFEDYKRSAYLEADLQCSNDIEKMEKKLRTVCRAPESKIENVIQVLDELLSDYQSSSNGPGKWKKLAVFLQQSLDGPVLEILRKQLDQMRSEKSALELKYRSHDDQLDLLRKQLEANEKHRSEYLARYEKIVVEKQKISEDFSQRITNLQSKCGTLEERCLSLTKALDLSRNEYSDLKSKYEHSCLELKELEDKFTAQIAALESRRSAAEGRLAAVREQVKSVEEEATEWKRKYDAANGDLKSALERAALSQKRINKEVQDREDALRAEFSKQLTVKEEEIRNMISKIDHIERHSNALASKLESSELKLESREFEAASMKDEIKELIEKLEFARTAALSHERESKILEHEKKHIEEKYLSESKKFDEADERCKSAEREVKRAIESAEAARVRLVASEREKSEAQQLAMERLAHIEKTERNVQRLEGENAKLKEETDMLRKSEREAVSKIELLQESVEKREREIESMLSRSNEQRSSTVQVLDSLLATERAARAEANNRAEALSVQLQSTQSKLDALHQELTAIRLNETALDSKLRTMSHGKRTRGDEYGTVRSVEDMNVEVDKGWKRAKTYDATHNPEDGASAFEGEQAGSQSQRDVRDEAEEGDYKKYTVIKLKQELTKHGFGEQLLQLRYPSKKEVLALYEKHVLKK